MPFVALMLWLAGTAEKGKLISLPFCRGTKIFTDRLLADGAVAFCVQDGPQGAPRVVLTNHDSPETKLRPLNDFAVSDDGRLCAYFRPQSDTRYDAIFIVDVATCKKTDDAIYWTHYADFGWMPGGFYYSGYRKPDPPSGGYGPERVFYHRLGTSQSEDAIVYDDPMHPARKYQFLTTFDHRFLMLHILERVQGKLLTSEWFRREGGSPKFTAILPDASAGRTYLCDNDDDKLVVATTYKSPGGRIVSIDTHQPDESHWKTLIPGPTEDGGVVEGKLVVLVKQPDGGNKALLYSMDGRPEGSIPSEPGSTVDIQTGRKGDPYVFLSIESKGVKRYFWMDRRLKKLTPIE